MLKTIIYLTGSKAEHVIEPTVVLRYSKDNTAVRTRHAAYEKNQTLRAVLGLTSMGQPTPDASTLLYRVRSCLVLLHGFYQYNNFSLKKRHWITNGGDSTPSVENG